MSLWTKPQRHNLTSDTETKEDSTEANEGNELKSIQDILPIHKAQLLSYMKLLDVPVGLIINFHEMKLVDGIVRMILPGANQ